MNKMQKQKNIVQFKIMTFYFPKAISPPRIRITDTSRENSPKGQFLTVGIASWSMNPGFWASIQISGGVNWCSLLVHCAFCLKCSLRSRSSWRRPSATRTSEQEKWGKGQWQLRRIRRLPGSVQCALCREGGGCSFMMTAFHMTILSCHFGKQFMVLWQICIKNKAKLLWP